MKNTDFQNPPIHEKLSHLSKEQLEGLIERYYKEKVQDLIQEFKLDVAPSSLLGKLPPKVYQDRKCENCNVPLWQKRKAKTDDYNPEPALFCPKCGKVYHSIIDFIKHFKSKKQTEFDKYDFEKLLILSCILYASNISYINEDLNYDKLFSKKLGPTPKYSRSMLTKMFVSGQILIDQGEINISYEIIKKMYRGAKKPVLESMFNHISTECPIEIKLDFWKNINAEECIEYYEYSFKKIELKVNDLIKIKEIFLNFLEIYSASQIFRIINKCILFTLKKLRELDLTDDYANKIFIESCITYNDIVSKNNWVIYPLNRPIFFISKSVINIVFFGNIIRIGDNSYYNVPSYEYLEKRQNKFTENNINPMI